MDFAILKYMHDQSNYVNLLRFFFRSITYLATPFSWLVTWKISRSPRFPSFLSVRFVLLFLSRSDIYLYFCWWIPQSVTYFAHLVWFLLQFNPTSHLAGCPTRLWSKLQCKWTNDVRRPTGCRPVFSESNQMNISASISHHWRWIASLPTMISPLWEMMVSRAYCDAIDDDGFWSGYVLCLIMCLVTLWPDLDPSYHVQRTGGYADVHIGDAVHPSCEIGCSPFYH